MTDPEFTILVSVLLVKYWCAFRQNLLFHLLSHFPPLLPLLELYNGVTIGVQVRTDFLRRKRTVSESTRSLVYFSYNLFAQYIIQNGRRTGKASFIFFCKRWQEISGGQSFNTDHICLHEKHVLNTGKMNRKTPLKQNKVQNP